MNRFTTTLAPAILLATAASAAIADAVPLTRAAVIAELAEARRTGNYQIYELGITARQLDPQRYPPQPQPAGKTREQVRQELAEALRTGDIVTGYSGLKRNEISPESYPRARPSPNEVLAGKSVQP